MEPTVSDAKRGAKKEDQRKKAGWLAGLLRGGSTGAAGSGAVNGAVVSAAGSALLAAKGGLLVSALVAVTLAGGMALLGYRNAKVAALAQLNRERVSVFAPKPAEPADAAGSADAAAGASNSLSMLVAGNASHGYAAYARGDVATASMRAGAAAPAPAAAAVPAAKNDADVSGNKAAPAAAAGALRTVSVEAVGATGASGGSPSAGTAPAAALAAISKTLSAAASAPKAMTAFGVQKTLSSRRFGSSNALRMLGAVRHDQAGAASSQAAGTTYDGARPSPASAAMAAIQLAQAGAAAGPSGSTSLGSQASAMTPPPPTAAGRNATPWQNAVNTAMMCVLGAAACLMIISKIKWDPMLKPVVLILAGVAAMLSTVTISMGSMLMSGKYGQTFQGKMFTLSGGLMLAASAAAVIGLDAMGGGKGATAAVAEESGSANLWMIAAGGASLAAAMVGYISQPKVVNDPYFKGGTPDWDGTGKPTTYYKAPSEDALARFMV